MKGAVAALEVPIYFETNSATLTAGAQRNLDTIGDAIGSARLSPCCFEVQGHTDSSGPSDHNLALSKRRAQSVVDYLSTKHKIDATRLMPAGYGEDQPKASNDTAAGKRENRRVVLVNMGYGEVEG